LCQEGSASSDIVDYFQDIKYETDAQFREDFTFIELLSAWNGAKRSKAIGSEKLPSELFNYKNSEKFMWVILKFCNKMLLEGNFGNILKDVVFSEYIKQRWSVSTTVACRWYHTWVKF
jgi:hypothetical protein